MLIHIQTNPTTALRHSISPFQITNLTAATKPCYLQNKHDMTQQKSSNYPLGTL